LFLFAVANIVLEIDKSRLPLYRKSNLSKLFMPYSLSRARSDGRNVLYILHSFVVVKTTLIPDIGEGKGGSFTR
jgi:hypothetical protein